MYICVFPFGFRAHLQYKEKSLFIAKVKCTQKKEFGLHILCRQLRTYMSTANTFDGLNLSEERRRDRSKGKLCSSVFFFFICSNVQLMIVNGIFCNCIKYRYLFVEFFLVYLITLQPLKFLPDILSSMPTNSWNKNALMHQSISVMFSSIISTYPNVISQIHSILK